MSTTAPHTPREQPPTPELKAVFPTAITLEPFDCDETETPFCNDVDGNSCGGHGSGVWEVYINGTFDHGDGPMKDTIVFVEHTSKGLARYLVRTLNSHAAALAALRAAREELFDLGYQCAESPALCERDEKRRDEIYAMIDAVLGGQG